MPVIERLDAETGTMVKEIVFQGVSPESDLIRDDHLHHVLRGPLGDFAPLSEYLRRMSALKERLFGPNPRVRRRKRA